MDRCQPSYLVSENLPILTCGSDDRTEDKFHGRLIIGQSILSPVTLGEGVETLEKDVLGELISMTVF